MNPNQSTQEAFLFMDRLAQTASYPAIDEDTKKIINKQIRTLLTSIVEKALSTLTAQGAGILINT